MKRNISILIGVLIIVCTIVGATLAFLAASSHPVINTFTVGNVQLELTETTGSQYRIIPGATLQKDPHLTVKANSETCWLFFKVEKSQDFDNYMTYTVAPGWVALPGATGVYYRTQSRSIQDTHYLLLENDEIRIRSTVTEQQLATLTAPPTLSFTGYAVQMDGIATAQQAWECLNTEGGAGS